MLSRIALKRSLLLAGGLPDTRRAASAVLEDFRAGRKDCVPIWMKKNGRTVYVNYMAVRDKEHNYLGTLEVVQDMEFAREHFAD